jgi:hypothetical protein
MDGLLIRLVEINPISMKYQLHYEGSKFWLIFWMIVFFPVALVLLLISGRFAKDGKMYSISYGGSRFWICFWTLLFFPVGILLLFLNGFTLKLGDPQ